MTVFVDTSVWFAAAVGRDHDNARAKSILASTHDHVTTDHVLVETWLLLNSRYHRQVAEQFWERMRRAARIELITAGDLERAWTIGAAFPDQSLSLVDRTSFAVIERLGLTSVASFDSDFAIYRYGASRDKAFTIVTSGHSPSFRAIHEAILARRQISCRYRGRERALCPHILGHTDGEEKLLAYQVGGASSGTLPQWRCFRLAELTDVRSQAGSWHTEARHTQTQRCVHSVYVDVNAHVPNQPGRR